MRKLAPFLISRFSGQNDHDDPSKTRLDQGVAAQNIFTDEVNAISVQPKATLVSALPTGVAGAGLWTYLSPSGQNYAIGANEGSTLNESAIYSSVNMTDWTQATYPSDDIGTNTPIYYTAPFVPEGTTSSGLFYLCTGLNDFPLLTFDGTDWIPAGSAKLAFESKGSGNLKGVYKYLITYTVDGEEIVGCTSFPMDITDAGGAKIHLTKIPLGPPNMTAKKLYRTKDSGSSFYFVADIGVAAVLTSAVTAGDTSATVNSTENLTVGEFLNCQGTAEIVQVAGITSPTVFTITQAFANNYATGKTFSPTSNAGATSYLDDVADASLGAAMVSPNPGIPPAHFPVDHQTRLWLIKSENDPARGIWSIPGFPFLFSAVNLADLPIESEVIWGARSYKETLVIGTGGSDRNIFVVSGDGGLVTAQFSIDRRVTGIGFLFHRSLVTFYVGEEQFMIFQDIDGFYLYDGSSNPRRISDDIYNTIKTLVGPDTNQGYNLVNTQAEWTPGTPYPTISQNYSASGDLDVDTIPGAIQLTETPQSFTTPTINGISFGYGPNNAGGFAKSYPPNTLPISVSASPGPGPITTFAYDSDVYVPKQYADALQIKFNFGLYLSVANGAFIYINPHYDPTSGHTYGAGPSAWWVDFFIISYQDANNIEHTLIDTNGWLATLAWGATSIPVNSPDCTLTASFPKDYVTGIRYRMSITNKGDSPGSGPFGTHGDVLSYKPSVAFNTDSIQLSIKQYVPSGTWTGQPVDTGTALAKVWNDFTSVFNYNGQGIQFRLRSADNESNLLTTPWIVASAGVAPPYPATNRWFQEQVFLYLPSILNMPLTDPNAMTYPAITNPQDVVGSNNPYPFNTILGTGGIPGGYQTGTDIDQLGVAIPVLKCLGCQTLFRRDSTAQGPAWVPLNNARGWTVETRFKIINVLLYFPIQVDDDVSDYDLFLQEYQISLEINGSQWNISYNLKDGNYHTIRLTAQGTAVNVYVDTNPSPILSVTATYASSTGNFISFGSGFYQYLTISGPTTDAYNVNYVSWNALGVNNPAAVDNTQTPVVESLYQAWLYNPEGIIPTTTVAAAYWKNRYWCAATELRSNAENFNNMVMIYDKNRNWVMKRGETYDPSNPGQYLPCFIGAFTVFQNKLYWIESNSVKICSLNENPSDVNLGVYNLTPTNRDMAKWTWGKWNFGLKRQKEFDTMTLEYACDTSITITATVDGNLPVVFTFPPNDGSQSCEVTWPADGRQIGSFLQLEVSDGNGGMLLDYKILSLEIHGWLVDYDEVAQQGTAT